jgi:hypothetical protein
VLEIFEGDKGNKEHGKHDKKTNLIHINIILLREEVPIDLDLDLQYFKHIFILI